MPEHLSPRESYAKMMNRNATAPKSASILLVDDNDVNRKVASNILIKSGCKIVEAIDGFEAIEKVQETD